MQNLLVLAFLAVTISNTFIPQPPTPQREETKLQKEEVEVPQPIQTKSDFQTKIVPEVVTLPKTTQEKLDPEKEAGEDEVLDGGEEGKTTKIYKITYLEDKEFEKELLSSKTIDPKPKIVLKGTKIVWKTLNSPDGEIKYWKKMRVYATHYDSHCLGCDETTAIGLRAGKGVIAVDPKVIPLRSKVYIPEYGLAIAGDTGGAIKGSIIDLGFDDARTSGWTARFVDIYLL